MAKRQKQAKAGPKATEPGPKKHRTVPVKAVKKPK